MTQPAAPVTRRIAMLIDGDNAQASLMEKMIAEAGRYGLVTIRRVYGDWTTTNMNSWKELLSKHAIQPIQQFRNTVGKNATDSALIIDAMDIANDGLVSGFCLVSSDSDYTRLATRLREKGFFVMGIGRADTPKAFVNACEVFISTKNLTKEGEKPHAAASPKSKVTPRGGEQDPRPLLREAFDLAAQDDGWAQLGTVGSQLRQLDPAFDPRTYGYKQLSQLVRAFPEEYEIREHKAGGVSTIYITARESGEEPPA